jgi:hypothetical protein
VFGSVTVVPFSCREPGSSVFIELRPPGYAGWCSTGRTWIRRRCGETGCSWPACEPPTSYASSAWPDAAFSASLHRLLADQLDDLRRALQIRSGAA